MGLAYLKNVATLRINQDKCVGGCNFCVEVCPHGVLSIQANKVSVVDLDLCIECGACAINCPFNAISVVTAGCGCAKALIRKMVRKRGSSCSEPQDDKGPSCCQDC